MAILYATTFPRLPVIPFRVLLGSIQSLSVPLFALQTSPGRKDTVETDLEVSQ